MFRRSRLLVFSIIGLLLSMAQLTPIARAESLYFGISFDLLNLQARVSGSMRIDPLTYTVSASASVVDIVSGNPIRIEDDLRLGLLSSHGLTLIARTNLLFGSANIQGVVDYNTNIYEFGSFRASIGNHFVFESSGDMLEGTSTMTFTGDLGSLGISHDWLNQDLRISGRQGPPGWLTANGRLLYWYSGDPSKFVGEVSGTLTDIGRKFTIITSAIYSFFDNVLSLSGTTREESAVGGITVSIDKFGLLAPYIGLTSTIVVATVATAIYVKRVKRRKEKQ